MLSPVRDVAGWFSDTLNAKSQVDQLAEQVDTAARRASPAAAGQAIRTSSCASEVELDNSDSIDAYHPVAPT